MIKNEMDIVEAFIRYHISFLNGMVILDNGSTDNTSSILSSLAADGLNIYIINDDTPAYNQDILITKLFYTTLNLFNPDFIIPIDIDEFLITGNRSDVLKSLQSVLEDNTIHYLSWRTYVPTPNDNVSELNIIKRITYRRQEENNHDFKFILSTEYAKNHKILIKQGNHGIIEDSAIAKYKSKYIDNIYLAHFPIRSKNQAMSKYVLGWLAYLAKKRQVLFDWYYYYNIIKSNFTLTDYELTKMALHYNVIDKSIKINIIDDQIHIKDDYVLKYTKNTNVSFLSNLLNYSENLARKFSELDNSFSADAIYRKLLILQIIKNYELIDGWLSANEAIELYELANSFDSNKEIVICEIGCWLGKSTYVLSKAVEHKKKATIFSIDPFDGSGDNKSEGIYNSLKDQLNDSLYDTFISNLRRFNSDKNVVPIKGYSQEIIKNFDKKIDLLFIDGNHNYQAVLQDYELWSPFIKKGGFIVLHDVGSAHTTGPKQVVEKFIVKNPIWGDYRLIDELYWSMKIV